MKTIIKWCHHCGKKFDFQITDEQYERYKEGVDNLQDIFPELSIEDKHLLNTGICYDCFLKIGDDALDDWFNNSFVIK